MTTVVSNKTITGGLSRRRLLGALAAVPGLAASHAASARVNIIGQMSLDGAPGLAAGVVRDGKVIVAGGKGVASQGSPGAPNRNTVFEIGSLTKTFTACLIFQLQEEGLLRVDAPIGAYVGDLPDAWRDLKLTQLLSHTSGLPNYINADNFMSLMPQDLRPRELIALVADTPLLFAPGERHEYCNTGFILLGMAAEAVTRVPYWDQLERRFFRPGGMTSTGPRNRLKPGKRLASGAFWNGDELNTHPPLSAPGSTWSAGGLLSTAADMDRWSIALDRGILSASVRQAMWQPATLADGSPAGWGFGWQIETVDGKTVVSHGGGTAGFSCWYRRDLSQPLSTIVLTNQNGKADPKSMTDGLLKLLLSHAL